MFLNYNVWTDRGPFTWSICPMCHIWSMKCQEDRVRWELSSSKSITWAFSFCFLLHMPHISIYIACLNRLIDYITF